MLPDKKSAMYLVLAWSVVFGAGRVFAQDTIVLTEMVDQGGGTLKQVATGLEWAQSDNGSDINWTDAGLYCASKGSGWRLPSVEELRSLYDKTGTLSTTCGAGYSCRISPLFRLTGPWTWSSEPYYTLSAWFVTLTNGTSSTYSVSSGEKKRALCVMGL